MNPKPELTYHYVDGSMKSDFIEIEKDGKLIQARFGVTAKGQEYWESNTGLRWEEPLISNALGKKEKRKKGGEEKITDDLNTPSY